MDDQMKRWTSGSGHIYPFAAFLLVVIPLSTITVAQTQGIYWAGNFPDFSAYWIGVERWQHGVPLYASKDFGLVSKLGVPRFFQYLYPPTTILIFYFYQLFPYTVAATLWGVTTAGMFWLSIVILLEEYMKMTWQRRLMLLPAVCCFQPVWYAFRLGQITPLLAAFVVFSGVAMERTQGKYRDGLIGVGVTLAAFIKPFAAPAGAVLLLSRRRLLAALTTVTILYGVGVAIFGVDSHIAYVQTLVTAKSEATTTVHPFERFHAGWFEPFDILGVWAWGVRISLLIIVAGLSLIRDDSLTADRAAFAAGSAVIPLAAPEVYSLSFVFYVPAVLVLAAEHPRLVPLLGIALINSHFHSWIIRFIFRSGLTSEQAVFLQPGLYAGFAILGVALTILWRQRVQGLGFE